MPPDAPGRAIAAPRSIATHDGEFHPDDLGAVALTHLVWGPVLAVVRTRDPQQLAVVDWRLDVGGRADETTGDFDHHFVDSPVRTDGTRYAALGLVWHTLGQRLVPSVLWAWLDTHLIAPLDRMDTGQPGPITPAIAHLADAWAAPNPTWEEIAAWRTHPSGAEIERTERDRRFGQTEARVRTALATLLTRLCEAAGPEAWPRVLTTWAEEMAANYDDAVAQHAQARARAQNLVAACWAAGHDGVVELMAAPDLPWREHLRELPVTGQDGVPLEFVLSPGDPGTVLLTGIPADPSDPRGALRHPLPVRWAGQRDADLAAVTGLADAIFCHPGRWVAGFGSLDSARHAAQAAREDVTHL